MGRCVPPGRKGCRSGRPGSARPVRRCLAPPRRATRRPRPENGWSICREPSGRNSIPARIGGDRRFSKARIRKYPTGWRRKSGERKPSRSRRSGSRLLSCAGRRIAQGARHGAGHIPGGPRRYSSKVTPLLYCRVNTRLLWAVAWPGSNSMPADSRRGLRRCCP